MLLGGVDLARLLIGGGTWTAILGIVGTLFAKKKIKAANASGMQTSTDTIAKARAADPKFNKQFGDDSSRAVAVLKAAATANPALATAVRSSNAGAGVAALNDPRRTLAA